ncbi:uncharacterized protein KZ484_002563 [Pholidichthys leucotaenia]
METEGVKESPPNSQLIFVNQEDTIRLLEVYVKRSLSLNDGTLGLMRSERTQKWVTMPKRIRRHSSDPSVHLTEGLNDKQTNGVFVSTPEANQPETFATESETPTKKTKKNKKPSFWKNILGFFTRKNSDEEEHEGPSEMSEDTEVKSCIPPTPVTLPKKSMRKKTIKRRFSKRRLSLIKSNKSPDITGVEAVVSVTPTYSYYEKVTEELEKIVQEVHKQEEVQTLSDEEVINRIIALTKEQGDAIDEKLKENPTLSGFFQKMTYSSFQKLADAYLEKETTPVLSPPTVPPTAPELVKLAFTLDFTARIAGLSRQNIGHITGLGNRYLQDRFEYKQVCTDHPWSDSDD